MGSPLLKTKLYIPPRRPNTVLRPRLTERLEQAVYMQHGLTLVSAKAGAGKTTLVSEWLHRQKRPAAWLSLDATDSEPQRFIRYLVTALQQLNPQIGRSALNLVETSHLPQAEALVAELVNDLTNTPAFILVLDDYHLIQDEWIHQTVGHLTKHQLPNMHLVLITRVDPPLSLAHLRGRSQVIEIRDRDLRFTQEEVDKFLNHVMNLKLSVNEISTIENRTEGWIVGLQMAAISMQGRKNDRDLASFIKTFGGTNRYILDYLVEEVLKQQPPTIQDFLTSTSILERMCAGLCDAVRFGYVEQHGSLANKELGQGKEMNQDSLDILSYLEQTNLFVIPLDDERRWYRYHHLFADLLNSTLRQHRSVYEIRELHRRASSWHQHEGSLEEAMIHAMAAEDFERAAKMIDENIVSMLSRSEGPVLLGWIEKLPKQIVLGRPWIDINRAYTLALSGRPDKTDPLLDSVEKRIEPDSPRGSELKGHIAAIRSYTSNLWGDSNRVFEMASIAEKHLPKDHLIARGMAAYALAVTHFANDDIEHAAKESEKMLKIGKKLDRLLMILTALCDLASTEKVKGQLQQAVNYYERAYRWMLEKNGLDTRVRSAYEVGLADLFYQKNLLDDARTHAVLGTEYCQRFDVPSELVSGYITLMRVCQAKGDVEGALGALRNAERIVQTHYVRLTTKILFKTARVKQWLAVGDISTAARWASLCKGGSDLEQIALGHVQLAKEHWSAAKRMLDNQRAAAQAGGRINRLIEILGLQAIALDAQGMFDEVNETMAQALAMARQERYVRMFLDLGDPFHNILVHLVERNISADTLGPGLILLNWDYAQDLLNAFDQDRKEIKMAEITSSATSAEEMIVPLTVREQEVLQSLAEGLTNKEIADRLVVAPSTVKQHLKNIYSKLDVHNRTQAVARGQELELL